MFGCQLTPNESPEPHNSKDAERGDEVRAEPILLLAFIEHDLQGANADHQQTDAPIIDALRFFADVWRIEDEELGHGERDDADGDVDVEDPSPAVVVSDPS